MRYSSLGRVRARTGVLIPILRLDFPFFLSRFISCAHSEYRNWVKSGLDEANLRMASVGGTGGYPPSNTRVRRPRHRSATAYTLRAHVRHGVGAQGMALGD